MARLTIPITAVRLLLAMTGIGSQMFTLLAPGFPLFLSVCPRLREAVTGCMAPLLAKVSSEYLGLASTLLTIMAPLVLLKALLKYLCMVLLVRLSLAVMTIFPFVVRLLVPMISGVFRLCIQVRVEVLLANELQVVAGTLVCLTSRPENSPEFLTRVFLVFGLK